MHRAARRFVFTAKLAEALEGTAKTSRRCPGTRARVLDRPPWIVSQAFRAFAPSPLSAR